MSTANEGRWSFMIRQAFGTLLLVLVAAAVCVAQEGAKPPAGDQTPAKDTVSGKYEGTAKTAGAADTALTLELKNEAGKLSGRLVTPGPVEISEGTLTDGKVSLKFGVAGKDGTLTGQLVDDKLTGEWIAGTQKRTVELKRVPAVDMAALLTGEWLAIADVQGGFPFALTLKVEGDKITGSSTSQLGESTITSGSWKDNTLVFVLESSTAKVGMTGVVVDGKLSGEFDFNGQGTGRWVATKKTP